MNERGSSGGMHGRMVRLAARIVCLACATASSVAAQDSTRVEPPAWLFGGSIGIPVYEAEPVLALLTIGVHWTQLRPGRLGADFALGTAPAILLVDVFAVGARGGVALPLALSPSVLLLPSGGVSLIAGWADGTFGYNAGIAAVLLGANAKGVRTGVTWHRFGDEGGAVWLWEFGFVRGPRSR